MCFKAQLWYCRLFYLRSQKRSGKGEVWLRPTWATTQKSPESSAQHLLYAASSNGKNNFSWLTSEYESKQNSFEGILSLRCQMNPLQMKVVCFPFLFNFIFLKFTAQICEKRVLSTMPKHGIKRGKNALLINIWGEALLTLKPVRVLRFLFSKFQFFISWWTQFYLFSFCEERKVIFFLLSINWWQYKIKPFTMML